MKIAILHEMFVKLGWAEKVVETWMKIYPKAELFTLMYDEKKCKKIFPKEKFNKQIFKLPSQKRYSWTKRQRLSINLMAKSVEMLDFSWYDLVLCSSSGFAHWAITKPETKFIVYYHSPSGYLWHQTNEYKKMIWWSNWLKSYFINNFFKKARIWDYTASARVDIPLIASKTAWKRIKKYYSRDDYKVIYPPVEIEKFIKAGQDYKTKDYYITISALTEWKNVDLIIKAFNQMPEEKIKIISDWNQRKYLESLVKNKNIKFVWYKDWKKLLKLIWESKGAIFAWVEDFWIAAVECLAAWKPVFWINKGWILETSKEWLTWEVFDKDITNDFLEKFKIFNENIFKWKYNKLDCQKRAKLFSENNHIKQIKTIVKKAI